VNTNTISRGGRTWWNPSRYIRTFDEHPSQPMTVVSYRPDDSRHPPMARLTILIMEEWNTGILE
jgi:hypothetical protein